MDLFKFAQRDLLAAAFSLRQAKAETYIEELHEVASEIIFFESGI